MRKSVAIADPSGRYNSRPMYGNHVSFAGECFLLTLQNGNILLGSDRAMVRYACDPYVYGALIVALVRGTSGNWLHLATNVTALYRAGSMEYRGSILGVDITITALPVAGERDNGFAARVQVRAFPRGPVDTRARPLSTALSLQ